MLFCSPRHRLFLLIFCTCLDFLALGISKSSRSLHTTLPQTGRLCFPDLLFLSTIQCDKIHSSVLETHSKWSAEKKYGRQQRGSTVAQQHCPVVLFWDWPSNVNFILYNKPSTWGCFCTDYTADTESSQTPIIGIMLLWKRHVVTTCSDMDFYIRSALPAVKQTTTVVLTRDLTLISVNWTVLLCCTDHVPAPCGRSVLLDLLNDAKWRCVHSDAVCTTDSCVSKCPNVYPNTGWWEGQTRGCELTNALSLSAWHVTQQWHGAVWIIQQRGHLRT